MGPYLLIVTFVQEQTHNTFFESLSVLNKNKENE